MFLFQCRTVSFDDTLDSSSAYLRVLNLWDGVLFDSTIFVGERERQARTQDFEERVPK